MGTAEEIKAALLQDVSRKKSMATEKARKLIVVVAAAIAVAGYSQADIADRPGSPLTVRVAARCCSYFDRKTNKTLTGNGKLWVDAMGNPVG